MKNKKVFKFQRKQILISNPLQSQHQNPQPQPQHPHRPEKPQESISSQYSNYPTVQPPITDKLQIPKQMRLENVVNKLKSKFVAMMEADPIIKVDQLFQSEIVCQITGNVPKNNRESFGRNKDKIAAQSMEDGFQEQKPVLQPNLFHQLCQSQQPNYLDLLQQGIPQHGVPLKQAFQREQRNRQESWDPRERNRKDNYFPHSNQTFQFERQQHDKRSIISRNMNMNMNMNERNRKNPQRQGLDRFQFS